MSEEVVEKKKELTEKQLAKLAAKHKGPKYKTSLGDKLISVITYIVYSFFAFACLYPFYYIFINTISNNTLSNQGKVIFLPQDIHFENYKRVFQIEGLFHAFEISVLRTFVGTILTVIIAAFLGYMFTRETMWKRKFWYRFVVATMYFNAGIIPWYLTMLNLGMLNNFWAYIFPMIVNPFYIVLCKTFVEGVPRELQEAAELDGAGTLRIFWSIIRPVIKPIIATIAIFAAVNQWNAFQDTLLLVTDSKLYTLQYVLYNYINSSGSLAAIVSSTSSTASIANTLAHASTSTSVRMTVTIFVVTPIILVYPFFQKYFTKGIMIGAVKG
ncbi:MAG: carbohydrate ABC transporter permease [Lachnospiraceae bacterium]|nr:carbohydrate ABC transporter permease [Lachnospiraceae bacterium]